MGNFVLQQLDFDTDDILISQEAHITTVSRHMFMSIVFPFLVFTIFLFLARSRSQQEQRNSLVEFYICLKRETNFTYKVIR